MTDDWRCKVGAARDPSALRWMVNEKVSSLLASELCDPSTERGGDDPPR